MEEKDFSLVAPVFKDIPAHKQEIYIKQGTRSWAFMAMNAIAERVGMLGLEAYKIMANGDEEPTKNPVIELLKKPNNLQTKSQFIWQMLMFYQASGEAPILLDKPKNPTELILLNPQKLEPIYDKNMGIGSYKYTRTDGVKVPIKEELIIFLNKPSLNTPFRGEGMMKYVADTLDTDYYFEQYLKKFFWNDATPGFILSTDQKMSKEWVDKLMSQMNTKHKSWKKAFKALVLTGGLKPSTVGLNLKELQIREMNDYIMNKVLATYKVPKAVLGVTDDVRANTDVADRTFSRYAISPTVNMLEEELNCFLLPKFNVAGNIILRFENPVKEDEKLNAEIHQIYVNSGVMTVNEVRDQLGLSPIEEVQPEEEQGEEPVMEDEEEPKEEEKSKSYDKIFEDMIKGNKPMKTRFKLEEIEEFHKKKIGITDQSEYTLREKLNKYFDQMINGVIRNTDKKSILKEGDAVIEYNDDIEEKKIVKLLIPVYEDIFEKQTGLTFALLGLNNIIPTTSEIFKDFVKDNALEWATAISETNKARILKIMADWAEKEESISSLKMKLKSVLEDQANHRIELIALTEVQRAANYASMMVYKQTGAIGYEWFTAEDERVCQFCRPMNGKKIYTNQVFFVKGSNFIGEDLGKLKFGKGSIPHPPLHGRCRCTLLGVYNESEMPNNPLKFREDSERRNAKREEKKSFENKQVAVVEKLTEAQQKIKERKKLLDEREAKIKEIEKLQNEIRSKNNTKSTKK